MVSRNPADRPVPAYWIYKASLTALDPPHALPSDPQRTLQLTIQGESLAGGPFELIVGAPRAMILGIFQTLAANIPTGDYVEGSE